MRFFVKEYIRKILLANIFSLNSRKILLFFLLFLIVRICVFLSSFHFSRFSFHRAAFRHFLLILRKLIQKPNQELLLIGPVLIQRLVFLLQKKENHIFDLIYNCHGCDSWDDIFRDYDSKYLEDKTIGVEIAINGIAENIRLSR